MKFFAFFILAIAASLQIACSSDASGPGGFASLQISPVFENMDCSSGEITNPGIIGGQTLTADSWLAKGAVFILEKSGDEIATCTGILLDRNIILTAAHCVNRSKVTYATNLRVAFDTKPFCSMVDHSIQYYDVEALEIHPQWQNAGKEEGDLALLRIKGRAPKSSKPMSLAAAYQGLANGAPVLVAGHGEITDKANRSPDFRLRVTTVHSLSDEAQRQRVLFRFNLTRGEGEELSWSDMQNRTTNEFIFIDQGHGHGICAGDSGGPALLPSQAPNEHRVIGVASKVFSTVSGATECSEGAIYTNTLYHRAWIDKTFQKLSTKATLKKTPFEK